MCDDYFRVGIKDQELQPIKSITLVKKLRGSVGDDVDTFS